MQFIDVSDDESVLEIRLARPDALNAVHGPMADEMAAVARQIEMAHDARAILLHGGGRAFMAGGDIAGFRRHLDDLQPALNRVFAGFHGLVAALRKAPQPVVAALHGAVAGGGLSLALACDVLVADEGTKFSLAYRGLGTSPDGGSTFTLPRLVGSRKAFELLLLRDGFSAQEALDLCLINAVVPDGTALIEARALAATLARNSPDANAATKRLLHNYPALDFEAHLAEEERAFSGCAMGTDFAEGVEAFFERRAPNFRGSVQDLPGLAARPRY